MSEYYYPCVLLMNDIHISKDNITEFLLNWEEALSICREKKIGLIAIGGDLFMSRSSQTLDVLLALHDAFKYAEKHDVNIFLINGNHDKVNQEAIRGYCHVFDQHNNVYVGDEYITIKDKENWNFALHMFAYFPENGSFVERLDRWKPAFMVEGKKNYLYLHEGINGALAHCSENELPPHIFTDFDRVFVGHYHNRCIIEGTNIEFIGSSRQHNFGEDEEKGYTILFNDGSQQFIKNEANARYRVMDVSVDKVGIHLTDELTEIKADGRYRVKVRVHGTTSQVATIDKKNLIENGAMKVELITEEPEVTEIASSSLFEKFDNNKIQENYQEFCKEKKIEDPSLGLSYLSKIDHYVETN